MSLLQKKYANLIPSPPTLLQTHNKKPLLLAAAAAAAATPLLAYAYSCYKQWRALGRGGVPYNVFGWLAQSALHLVARGDLDRPVPRGFARVEDVAALYGPAGAKSYLAPPSPSPSPASASASASALPRRKGAPPTVPAFVAPQRQTSDAPPPSTVERETAFLAALARSNPALFELRTSRLEGAPHEALWLRTPLLTEEEKKKRREEEEKEKEKSYYARLGRGSGGEWAHVHGEGSAHVTLSPTDAAAAIAAGWARRHALSGVGGRRAMVPWGYVLLYAPRDEGEWAVWRELVLAGARYVAEGAGLAVAVPE
ncbi:hypothetical protein F5Y05DRAFT_419067 [Hypoxylon sp. FL0543]|nr:hypothetical protein F5Y05DRAFT_419067 [Hypoxylon sp. FL0543]